MFPWNFPQRTLVTVTTLLLLTLPVTPTGFVIPPLLESAETQPAQVAPSASNAAAPTVAAQPVVTPSYGSSHPEQYSTHSIVVKHSDANYVGKLLKQLYRDAHFVVDERTNSLFIQTRGSELPAELKSLIETLDQPAPEKQELVLDQVIEEPPADVHQRRSGYAGVSPYGRGAEIRLELRNPSEGPPALPGFPANQSQQLRMRYEAAERESQRLAEELSQLGRSGRESDNRPRRDQLRQQLDRSVNNAFDVRQQLQEMEVAQLRKRVEQIQQRIATRRELRDRIVGRRIEDLLNPEQTWDSEPQPRPEMDLLHVVPEVTGPLPPNPFGVLVAPGVPAPTPSVVPLPAGAPRELQFQIDLKLVETPPEPAAQMGLPRTVAEDPASTVTRKPKQVFEAEFEKQKTIGALKILAEPRIVTTLGRAAALKSGGEIDGKPFGLEMEALPIRWENGRLQLKVNAKVSEARASGANNDLVPSATQQVETVIEIAPGECVIAGPWSADDTDRLVYAFVQAEPMDVLIFNTPVPPPALGQVRAIPPSATRPGPTPTATRDAPAAAPEAAPTEAWPRKLPSDYAAQRQQILREVTDALASAAAGQGSEVFSARLDLLSQQARQQLRILAQEYEAQRQVLQAQVVAQEAMFDVAKAEYDRLAELFKQGVISASELSRTEVNFKRLEAAVRQAVKVLEMFESNRETIVDDDQPQKIIEQMQRAGAEYRKRLQRESSEGESRSEPTSGERR